MKKRHIALMLCPAPLVASCVAAATPEVAERTHTVHPGESIQRAVDSARTGDTVLVLPGTYHGSVKVTTPGITLRGTGDATVIEPVAKSTDDCGKRGNGICVAGTAKKKLKGVTVADLKVTGFSHAGVVSVGSDGLTVRHVTADKNGVWGLAEERSQRSTYQQNTARYNGDAGIFLANTIDTEQGATDTRNTLLSGNRLQGNRIGVTIRRLRDLTVTDNDITGNCAGVMVVGDENKPKGGALTVRGNRVVQNNKYCPKTERLPFLQGSGIVLTGVEKTDVTGNAVTGHSGSSPLSGGIVLFKSFVGATNDNNRIRDNSLQDNHPADVVNQESTARGNTFVHNACRASKPAGLC
ncbi:right-handed parallel beta-helix repeat-containing protein [Streptomyces tropicalis]|uniref:NosD domain-containing protein n=1 Tax=Streptomyces tropicalis TaxID=3034234 RepID=A0ABT6AAU1_9ACTN|nr:right-handed parallel beta-helix repeat-containing protein [Streptomyces tropicalis]MDF3301759.1 NosD domain-containing protein [Streptomyces tropicalis]